jgi:formate dehydrogenase major subunit
VPPPGEARDDIEIIGELARRMGVDWGNPTARELWDELRSLSPLHRGMTYERLESEGGLQWPCPDENHPGSPFLHGWLWADDLEGRDPAPFSVVEHAGPAEELTDEFPLRLTTGRALDSYNTGVQSGSIDSPIRYGNTIDLATADAARLGIEHGEVVRVVSPRGSVDMPVRVLDDLPNGLTFTTFHFPELADVNVLTNDTWDKKSGTAEFKAASIRVEKLAEPSIDSDSTTLEEPGSG